MALTHDLMSLCYKRSLFLGALSDILF